MVVGGDGHWVLASMWAMTLVTFIFVLLRTYTRIYVVKSFGVDDHVYNLAFVSLDPPLQSRVSLTLPMIGLSAYEHYIHDCRRPLWLRSKHTRHHDGQTRRPTSRNAIRSCQPNFCYTRYEHRKGIPRSLSTTTCQGEMAQDSYLVHDDLPLRCIRLCMLRLLVSVHSTTISLGSSYTRTLHHRHGAGSFDSM
jgi:hypothetical protein